MIKTVKKHVVVNLNELLAEKLQQIRSNLTYAYGKLRQGDLSSMITSAQIATVNNFSKFYGLRSKYDGRGNLRTPLKG